MKKSQENIMKNETMQSRIAIIFEKTLLRKGKAYRNCKIVTVLDEPSDAKDFLEKKKEEYLLSGDGWDIESPDFLASIGWGFAMVRRKRNLEIIHNWDIMIIVE